MGDNNCYGTQSCTVRPYDLISRAEIAVLIQRAFQLDRTGSAPQFIDSPEGRWYTESIETLADHCVFMSDDIPNKARPHDLVTRAELVVMFYRLNERMQHGMDCGPNYIVEGIRIDNLTFINSTVLEMEMPVASDERGVVEDIRYYSLSGTNAPDIASATLLADNVVEIMLTEPLAVGQSYTLSIRGMPLQGSIVDDTISFTASR